MEPGVLVLRTTCIGMTVIALLSVSSGVAEGDTAPLADVNVAVQTPDGYQLSASLTDMTINSVPNMAATAFSREAYLSGTAIETITGRSTPVKGGKLELALMVGCQVDLSNGGALALTPTVSLSNAIGNILAPITAIGADPSSSMGAQGSLSPKPGTIVYQKLNTKTIDPADASDVQKNIEQFGQASIRISVHDAHIKQDSCGGPVSVRLIATAQMFTKNSSDESNAYGPILSI